ncbi:MAG: 1,4-alpha-glucan branching enzyme, partial [Phyllobacteriaceae bacterium]|nr:1,4-alpha-glucan branching enzyme [Phyllobacteriaceae bacterium]
MAEPKWRLSAQAIEAIVHGRHANPFEALGLHQHSKTWLVRAFVPGALGVDVHLLDGTLVGALEQRHGAGFFEGAVKLKSRQPLRLSCCNEGGAWTVTDAYTFGPVLGPMDDYYIGEGNHLRLYDKLGAHPLHHEGCDGVHFAVWAPNAERVSVIGDFNNWDGRLHVMRKRLDTGIWETFVPDAHEGQGYKFELLDKSGKLLPLKADPFGFAAELRPNTASKVARTDGFKWHDEAYLKTRRERDQRRAPMSIYEVHAGSWRRGDGNRFLTYDELAD